MPSGMASGTPCSLLWGRALMGRPFIKPELGRSRATSRKQQLKMAQHSEKDLSVRFISTFLLKRNSEKSSGSKDVSNVVMAFLGSTGMNGLIIKKLKKHDCNKTIGQHLSYPN